MTTLTRATLGSITKRQTKELEICGHKVRIQKLSPLEYSQYQTSISDPKTQTLNLERFASALLTMVARMWIDDDGNRIFADNEIKQLGEIDLEFYQKLSEQCQLFCRSDKEADETLGESDLMPDLGLPAESV
jgi:hypothetical protein